MQTTERERQAIYREFFERHEQADEQVRFIEEWVARHAERKRYREWLHDVAFCGIVGSIVLLAWLAL